MGAEKRKVKMKKQIVILMLVCFLVLPIINAQLSFDNTESFDEKIGKYGKYEIRDWFGLQKLAEIELKNNTEKCGINVNQELR